MAISITDLPEENKPKPVVITIGEDYDLAKHQMLMELAKTKPVIVHSSIKPTLGKFEDFNNPFDFRKVLASDFIISLTRTIPANDDEKRIYLTKISNKNGKTESDNG